MSLGGAKIDETGICGGAGAVVNEKTTSSASVSPSTSVTLVAAGPPLRVTLYFCSGCSGAAGTSLTLNHSRSKSKVKGTGAPAASVSRTVLAFTLAGSSCFAKYASGATVVGTPVEVSEGTVTKTVNGTGVVVKLHVTSAARGLPAKSFTRGSVLPPLTLAVYVTRGARSATGFSTAVNEIAS